MALHSLSTLYARSNRENLNIRRPKDADGAEIWRLVSDSGALDENSMYCNLLQCTHFASTCAVAELDGEIVGWVSGYIPPEHPDTLFIWQVCVSSKARGRGLAKRLISAVLRRKVCANVARIHTTITDDNEASWALFGSMARELETEMNRSEHFEEEVHFDGAHETEHLVSIGPFERESAIVRSAA